MYRLVSWFLLLALVMVGSAEAASNKTLLTIDGTKYTTQDYRDWWRIWQDPGMGFPPTPRGYIDYLLFVEEGRQMEYDLTPEYRRKLEVYLKVRSISAFKVEEIDRKINITEKQIREFFANNYAPVWSLQILAFDDQVKAQAVVDMMRAFNGQKAGRLVFADFSGVKKEEGGPLTYDEVSVDPATISKNKNDRWLSVISNLQKWFVAEPFFLEEQNRYVVIRMDGIDAEPGEENLEKKRDSIKRKLAKRANNDLTAKLLERLKKEQHLTVDQELLEKVNLKDDYPEEILKKSVVKMDDFTFSAGLLIKNMKDQQQRRIGLAEEKVKKIVINAVISQTLINNAALNRHYENRPPLKARYDFYSENSLRKSLEAGIKKGIQISSEEVESYYDNNQSLYSESAMVSYVIIQGDVDLMNTISMALTQGADFFDQAKAYSLDDQIKTQEIDKIRPELQVLLSKLKRNEVSALFRLDEKYAILRLLNRTEERRISLEQVRANIKGILLKEKFGLAKAVYLEKMKSLMKIEVNQGVWEKLKQEYEK